MRITAVVVAHSRPDLLPEVVAALQGQTRPVDRIVVVDNAGGPATQAVLRGMNDVVVVRSDTNVGGAGGFALGMRKARQLGSDWTWLMDDDAIPRADALAALVDALPHIPGKLGGVCGTVIEYGDIATAHRRTFGFLLGLERPLPRSAYAGSPVPIDTGSFVGFMVPAHAVAMAGLPDPDFFLAYDDTEYSLRLRSAGFGIWLIPASVVDHMRALESRLRMTPFGYKHYFNIRNRIVVKMSYARFRYFGLVSGVCFGCALWAVCKERLRRQSLQILVRAIADGYRGRLGPYPEGLEALSRHEAGRSLRWQK